jgi:hypothetical protein
MLTMRNCSIRTPTYNWQAMAEELLATERQTEMTMKRLKRGQQAAVADEGLSNVDKITLQFFLDAQVCKQWLCWCEHCSAAEGSMSVHYKMQSSFVLGHWQALHDMHCA